MNYFSNIHKYWHYQIDQCWYRDRVRVLPITWVYQI